MFGVAENYQRTRERENGKSGRGQNRITKL